MADGFVDSQPQVGRVDHQIRGPRRHTGRFDLLGQQHRQLRKLLGPVPYVVSGQRFPASPHRRRQRAHRVETARGRIDGDRLQRRIHPYPLLGDRRTEGIGVERLLFDRRHHSRHVVHTVGGQQPPGVLGQHRNFAGRGDLEWVDLVVRHPAGVGVHRLGRQLDVFGVQRGQRGRHMHRAARRFGGDRRRELGVRREPPGAPDDHPHRQADLAAHDGGLQLTVTQLDDLGAEPLNPQVGIAGPGRFRRLQRSFGQLMARQGQEVGVDIPVRCHGYTVTTTDYSL